MLIVWKKVRSLSPVQLFATPWTVAYQASPSMGFSRQEYWSGVPLPSPGESSQPRDRTQVSRIGGRGFNLSVTREDSVKKVKVKVKSLSPVRLFGIPWTAAYHGILQARILEWIASSFSRGSSWSRDRTQIPRNAGRCFNLWATRERPIQYCTIQWVSF